MNLSDNITLSEMLNGVALPEGARKLNQSYTQQELAQMKRIAEAVQLVRNDVLREFGKRFKGFQINAGLRKREWELNQGRSGNSRHTVGDAVDVVPLVVDAKDYLIIFEYIRKKYSASWNGGFAIKEPKNGKGGFIHFDLGAKRRWKY
jgi:uncharacterized protein YcbK (DUF882 family)